MAGPERLQTLQRGPPDVLRIRQRQFRFHRGSRTSGEILTAGISSPRRRLEIRRSDRKADRPFVPAEFDQRLALRVDPGVKIHARDAAPEPIVSSP